MCNQEGAWPGSVTHIALGESAGLPSARAAEWTS